MMQRIITYWIKWEPMRPHLYKEVGQKEKLLFMIESQWNIEGMMKLEKSPFHYHPSHHWFKQNHQWMLQPVNESWGKNRILQSQIISHKMLSDYKRKIQERNLVVTTWTKRPKCTTHSVAADNCVPWQGALGRTQPFSHKCINWI